MDMSRFIYKTSPKALEGNTVSGRNYRFTILTPSLIRMEYDERGLFEERASQSVFFRDFPQNQFSVERINETLKIETECLVLTYKEEERFCSDTMNIRLKIEPASTWCYGEDFEDLGGTFRTVDRVSGSTPLERGVCSRNGFSVLDDSETMLLNDEGWVEVRTPNTIDSYFFGYGFQYLSAVKDYYRLTGIPPMLPAYALGNWWSRYHAYTQDEYKELIERFEEENVPLSVSVIDMDWHVVRIPRELREPEKQFSHGWTGYSWNKELFPDYKELLRFLKKRNLRITMNLHPAMGIRQHEDMYEEMARANGIDPATKQRIPLDILSPEHMATYFDIIHHPYEEDGIDFWWVDWQQGTSYWWIHEENKDGVMQDEREVLDPQWMLNHLHVIDIQRDGKRPMFFSRYCGPGSQRYPVGFSGDSLVTWESLDFQPYYTATSSNIGYSWWSHDIGGHTNGYRDNELTTRWVQLGVFSPINRLHSCDNEFVRKEPWSYEEKTGNILKHWLRVRHKLFPYIYTMNYRNHAELEPLIQPMYYQYPKCNGAYAVKNQFMFGSELMVAPITSPNNKITCMGSTDVWLPKGDWFDFFTGVRYTSTRGKIMRVHREIQDYPVFAKAGAIVPLQASHELQAGNDLEVIVFPGKDNTFTLYEDAGEGKNFENGEYVTTEMALEWGDVPRFVMKPARGDVSLLPERRKCRIVLRGFRAATEVVMTIDGETVPVDYKYDVATKSLEMEIEAKVASEIVLTMHGESLITDNDDVNARCMKILQNAQLHSETKSNVYATITDEEKSTFTKIFEINAKCNYSKEHEALVSALKEQLTMDSLSDDYTFYYFKL